MDDAVKTLVANPSFGHRIEGDSVVIWNDSYLLHDVCNGECFTINYEAAAVQAVRFFQGERAASREVPPHIKSGVAKIVNAALGNRPRKTLAYASALRVADDLGVQVQGRPLRSSELRRLVEAAFGLVEPDHV